MERFDKKEEARLLLSVGTHKKDRPFGPIEAGRKLAIRCEGTPREDVAKKYGLSSEMLREFLSASKISPKAQQILDSWEIGIDKIYRISMLRSLREQNELATALLEYNLSSKEVRNIVQLKNRNLTFSITDCVKTVVKSRPIIERRHLVVTEIDNDTLEKIKEQIKSHNVSAEKLLITTLEKFLPSNSLISFKMRDKIIILNLNKEGFQSFKKKAEKLGVELDNLVETLARKIIS